MPPDSSLALSEAVCGPPDKQENNRDGFVAVVGLTVSELSPISGPYQAVEQSGITGLVREVGRRTLPWGYVLILLAGVTRPLQS